jgi:hypothetical protein
MQSSISKVDKLRKILEDVKYKPSTNQCHALTKAHKEILFNKFLNTSRAVYYKDQLLLSGFHRIVIGAHGPYIEFSAEHFRRSIIMTKGQEWRLNKKYNVKYLHMNPVGYEELKVYKQLKTVVYADYKVGMYYVDLYKVELRDE